MIVDARSLPAGTIIDSEVCIVGAGAAGVTLAREFSNARFRVTLLESGGMDYEPDTQELYEGESIGRPFGDLTASRLRFFGGTTNHWGGWCLPYDEIDFAPREEFPNHGWPFDKSHLDHWYRRAQEVCGLGPYDYRPASWGIPASAISPPFAGPHFECKILQVSQVRFGAAYAQELEHSSQVTIYLHANAFHFDAGDSEAEVRKLSVKTLSGTQFSIRARIYILAAGGIENARLLLASGKEGGNGLGNDRDLVGRYFMVHLIYSGGTIVPTDPHAKFDFRSGPAGFGDRHPYVPLVGLSLASMRDLQLANILIHWWYQFSPVADTVMAAKRVIGGEGPGGSLMKDLAKVIGDLDGLTTVGVRKLLFREGIPIVALNLRCASEQQPNPQSRVLLGSKRDRLGMRQIVVDWQPTEHDRSMAAATLRLLATEVGRTGFGRLRWPFGENDAWPDDFYGDEHHIGTTRMHRDPMQGVVDENCRVHSLANLYVAGSSVFPNSSGNNSTLTIVALALRLADHIKARLS
jgi:choline dehydrogenase-like flavoprotein